MKQSIIRKGGNFLRWIFNFQRLFFAIFLLGSSLIVTGIFAQQPPWVAPKTADNVKNPLSGDNSKLAETKTMYITNCGPCHGDKGKGDGPAAPGLNPKPADHTSAAVQSETDGAIFWKLCNPCTTLFQNAQSPSPFSVISKACKDFSIPPERRIWELRCLAIPRRDPRRREREAAASAGSGRHAKPQGGVLKPSAMKSNVPSINPDISICYRRLR